MGTIMVKTSEPFKSIGITVEALGEANGDPDRYAGLMETIHRELTGNANTGRRLDEEILSDIDYLLMNSTEEGSTGSADFAGYGVDVNNSGGKLHIILRRETMTEIEEKEYPVEY